MLRRCYWILTQTGIDPLAFLRTLRSLPRYFRERRQFRSIFTGRLEFQPCVHDYHEEGGSTKNEYFWQDLHVARKIFAAAPTRHVDVGSRFDGFVAHVASYRDIEVLDIRPMTSTIPGVTFRQADMMGNVSGMVDYCDSVSCLHALEHFGLGRYGDTIRVDGAERGLANLSAILKPGGTLYLSTPIGHERVVFNANWIFDPNRLAAIGDRNGLSLTGVEIFEGGAFIPHEHDDAGLSRLATRDYVLALFVFEKAA